MRGAMRESKKQRKSISRIPHFKVEGQEKQVSSVARKAANNECAQGAGWHVVA